MQLGFVSAIVPELSLESVLQLAKQLNYDCIECCCWPVSKAERRYAGVTHIDVAQLDDAAIGSIQNLCTKYGVSLSGLGYYPNPLAADRKESQAAIDHLTKVIRAAPKLGLTQVNTFIGRDPSQSIDQNWSRFMDVWPTLVKTAADIGVKIGIENCPMLFTGDEWPGGKNLAVSPSIWRRMFESIPSPNFGLNYDPSHMVWQQMDYLQPLREFRDRIFHVHAKDVRIDRHRLNDVGILAHPLQYHLPKLPGFGEVDWGRFFSVLSDTGYRGPVCVEVEDRAYEGSLEDRKRALWQSERFLRTYLPPAPIG
jgi:sugar phosphate isomerase/epimerase